MFQRRIEVGGQFFMTGPVMDPVSVRPTAERLQLADAPPVYLELTPPVSPQWVERIEKVGGTPVGEALRARLAAAPESERRVLGWRVAKAVAAEAREAGFAGIVIMGLRFSTAVDEAYEIWQDEAVTPFFLGEDA
jgi:5,10-methylenetetrahydrofolate reductase